MLLSILLLSKFKVVITWCFNWVLLKTAAFSELDRSEVTESSIRSTDANYEQWKTKMCVLPEVNVTGNWHSSLLLVQGTKNYGAQGGFIHCRDMVFIVCTPCRQGHFSKRKQLNSLTSSNQNSCIVSQRTVSPSCANIKYYRHCDAVFNGLFYLRHHMVCFGKHLLFSLKFHGLSSC